MTRYRDKTEEERARFRERQRKYYTEHKEECIERTRKWISEHGEERRKRRYERREVLNERNSKRRIEDPEKYKKYLKKWRVEHRDEHNERSRKYQLQDLNRSGIKKCYIRYQSRSYMFSKHFKIQGYEIHHAFGYDDCTKFIYIPKTLHIQIHRLLRNNNIPADSDHWMTIRDMVNSCEQYTYISV